MNGAERVIARLQDIRSAIEGIQNALSGKSFAEFQQDWLLRHAVQRAIKIISEATRHIPVELKDRHSYPYWNEVSGIGNVLRHEYQRVSDQLIWNVVEHHLPELKRHIDLMSADLDRDNGPEASSR